MLPLVAVADAEASCDVVTYDNELTSQLLMLVDGRSA